MKVVVSICHTYSYDTDLDIFAADVEDLKDIVLFVKDRLSYYGPTLFPEHKDVHNILNVSMDTIADVRRAVANLVNLWLDIDAKESSYNSWSHFEVTIHDVSELISTFKVV